MKMALGAAYAGRSRGQRAGRLGGWFELAGAGPFGLEGFGFRVNFGQHFTPGLSVRLHFGVSNVESAGRIVAFPAGRATIQICVGSRRLSRSNSESYVKSPRAEGEGGGAKRILKVSFRSRTLWFVRARV